MKKIITNIFKNAKVKKMMDTKLLEIQKIIANIEKNKYTMKTLINML